jgi:hypothetical protein
MEGMMKATYYSHRWVQEPDTRAYECHECGELTVYGKSVSNWVTIRPATWDDRCLVEFDYQEEL